MHGVQNLLVDLFFIITGCIKVLMKQTADKVIFVRI